ncbi:MAG: hypothetical protein LUC43_03520, partial [Burkholderiales bacterium]|nr:hypothetical protein [Burkholderiales bacterium]
MVVENPVNAIAIASNLVQRFAVRYERLYVPINPSRIAGQLGITVSREPKNDLNSKWIALAMPSRKWIRLVSQEDEEKLSIRRQMKMCTSM